MFLRFNNDHSRARSRKLAICERIRSRAQVRRPVDMLEAKIEQAVLERIDGNGPFAKLEFSTPNDDPVVRRQLNDFSRFFKGVLEVVEL